MGQALDLMEDVFVQIKNNGEMLLNEEFMMNIYQPLAEQVEPFQDYLT